MKRLISLLLVLVLMLTMAACGKDEEKTDNYRDDAEVSDEDPGETTLSPREQFQQQKEAMEQLQNGKETEPAQITAASFTAGGFTVNLDSTFKASYTQTDGLMSYWHSNGDSFSYTMKIGITPTSNYAGYTSSRQAAEDIAAQRPDERTVDSANGVYYIIQRGNINVIKAYYVDNSGMYWVIDGMTSGSVNFDDYVDQLIEFCTTGRIN